MAKKPADRTFLKYLITGSLGFFACFLFAIVTASVVGAYYPDALVAIHAEWLSVPLRGLYSDCSEPENLNASYCRPRNSNTYDMRRARIKEKQKPPPFTLYSSPG